jgi:peptidoglycan hydrolase-like protein with peptidoglycan-binding domain
MVRFTGMRTALRLALFLLISWASAGLAQAGLVDSRAWFEQLTEEERSATQTDLILLGHYEYLVDGRFGTGTFDALVAFQRSVGTSPTGVLSSSERQRLHDLARRVDGEFGIELVSDTEARVAMMIPGRLLSIRNPTGTGTSYVSADGEISLETMHSALTGHSFEDLFNTMTAPDPERVVTYRSFGAGRFVVSGQIGDYSYYTMFVSAGDEAIGYSLAWGKSYAREGAIASVYLASHFNPLSNLPPPPELEKSDGGAGVEASGQFDLPLDQPDVIVFNAEVDEGTPREFMQALADRPDARIVALNSPGGSVDAAIRVALELRKRGLATYVPADLGCYSACAYIFLAGSDRRAVGELGVHQISSEIADLVMAQTTLGDLLDALQAFGVHPQVISYMLRTPPDDMYVFSEEELGELGIENGDPIEVAVAIASPVEELSDRPGAFVHLASHASMTEAERSRDYLNGRWGTLFGEARPEIETIDETYRIRLPMPSLERANTVCSAIKADGGGCFVSAS